MNENQALDAFVGAKVDRATCLPRCGFIYVFYPQNRARTREYSRLSSAFEDHFMMLMMWYCQRLPPVDAIASCSHGAAESGLAFPVFAFSVVFDVASRRGVRTIRYYYYCTIGWGLSFSCRPLPAADWGVAPQIGSSAR